MKKIILLLCIQYSVIISAKEVHVVPVYQERLTNKWCGLFAHDAGGVWSTFKKELNDTDNGFTAAIQTLREQTNNVYSFDEKSLQSVLTLENGDMVYCVPVKHMTVPILNKKMIASVDQNVKKDKFMWLPMEDLLARITILKAARNTTLRCKFNDFTRAVFKKHWESYFQPDLNAQVNRQIALKRLGKRKPAAVKVATKIKTKPTEKKRVQIAASITEKPSAKNVLKQAHKTRWSKPSETMIEI